MEAPQSFVVRQECEKAAREHGFRRILAESEGWAAFESTTVPGTIHLASAGEQGPWFLALDHSGVIEHLEMSTVKMSGPGFARYALNTLGELYALLLRVYQLSASLPDAPLRAFREKVRNLPRDTEAERLVVQRIGQDFFRAGLMDFWRGRCPLTGISEPELLRASHIIPWKECGTDDDRLDVHNGLLLSALWDAAFDRGLVTFDDQGQPKFSRKLGEVALSALHWQTPIHLTETHLQNLAWHRSNLFIGA